MTERHKLVAMTILSLTLLLALTIVQTGCGQEASPTVSEQKQGSLPANEITSRALMVMASTIPTGEFPNNSISGITLARLLASGEESSKLFLLDTRSSSDFDKGHIEGSVQIDFGAWAAPENLSIYPRDKKIVVVDYLDDYSGEIVGGLRLLGFDAVALRGGINGWAQGFEQPVIIKELSSTDYPVDTSPAGSIAPAAAPEVFAAPSDTDHRLLADKAGSIFSGQRQGSNIITAAELSGLLESQDGSAPFVLDIRQRVDFNQGHIKNAVNIPFLALSNRENLEILPRDRKIVVTCAFASSSGQIVTILRMLDYDAVMLKHSMMSWNGFGKNTFLEYIQNANNPVVASP